MQIRVKAGQKEERISLAARFVNAVTEVASATLIKERKLTDYGVRYGELPEIAREVEQELEAAYPEERLQTIVKQAIAHGRSETEFVEQRKSYTLAEIEQLLSHEEWQQRYAALDALEPSEATMPLILKIIHDPKLQIRRLAVVYLGDIGSTEAISRLCEALQDSSPVIRRTAGDTLSDLGDPVATKSMIEALQDKSKLVRWRAARFLFDVGDERCVPALRDAIDDTEFEVSLQARMALERIEAGEEAVGTVWQQMANRER
jgi:HEAT repeat protein